MMIIRRLLTGFVATITRHERYFPAFEWSKDLWTHNVFRFFGSLFGEYRGIRPSVASWHENGVSKQVGYTLEAQCALIEVAVRASFKKKLGFKIVLIPQMQLAGMRDMGITPYRFAIAFDAASGQQTNAVGASNPALSHTCTGSNLFLAMWEIGDTGADSVTSMLYNAVAGTRIQGVQYTADRWVYVYGLKSPSTGANNITSTGNTFGSKAGTSYTGCNTTTQPDASSGIFQAVASTTATVTVTVVAANCWLLGYAYGGGITSAGTGTLRGTNVGSGVQPMDSNGTVSTGSQSITVNQGSSGYVALGMSVKIAASGPTNVKTWDAVAIASIKTFLGVATGSTKTVDGIS